MKILRSLRQLNEITISASANEFKNMLSKYVVAAEYDPAEAFKNYPTGFKGELADGNFLLCERRKFGNNTGILLNAVVHQGKFETANHSTTIQITTKLTEGYLIFFILQVLAITIYTAGLFNHSGGGEIAFIVILYLAVVGLFWFFLKSKIEMGAENFTKEMNYIINKNKI